MKQKEYCFLICSVKDDLPVAVCDTRQECCEFLDVCRSTQWKMEKHGHIVKGLYIEKVLL